MVGCGVKFLLGHVIMLEKMLVKVLVVVELFFMELTFTLAVLLPVYATVVI